ncbi:MAG: UvrD-helicase domain-containing protein [Acidimicrobiales bacterium]
MGVVPATEALLDGLNPAQLAAVTHGQGPLLVVAGAGSGKTRVLTRRIAYLMAERNVAPYQVLAITFTNKAAGEMKKRVAQLVGPDAADMWVSTFHSACVRILRRHAQDAGYRPGFTIYDQADSVRLARYVLEDLNIDTRKISPRVTAGAISAAKSATLGPSEVADAATTIFERRVAQAYGLYQERLRAANALDFDDLIMVTVAMLRARSDICESFRRRFRHILVDEYQDTNAVQNELVMLLGSDHGNVCVVGDTDQSVYRFRGADISNIMEFSTVFPDATVVKLEQNYRSTQNILDAANAVIANNERRTPKRLWTESGPGAKVTRFCGSDEYDEARWVVTQLKSLASSGQFGYQDMAVFYRANAQSRVLEEELVRHGVAYKVVGGIKFYDRKEVKDVLAYLRVLVNPDDEVSLKRILNVPKRGVGDASVARLDAWVAADDGYAGPRRTFAAAAASARDAGITGRALKGLEQLAGVLSDLGGLLVGSSPEAMVEAVIEMTGYGQELEVQAQGESGLSHEAEGRLENLAELVGMAGEYPDTESFLEAVALVADADELPDDEPEVVLMTLHTAKGLEFGAAFLVGMEDGVFPHARSLVDPDELEEERRLCYVGITRARQRLFLSNAWTRSLYGSPQYNPPSRFLDEIPESLLVHDPHSRQFGGSSSYGWGSRRSMGSYDPDDEVGSPPFGGGRRGRPAGGGDQPRRHPVRTTGAELLGLVVGDAVVHTRWGEGTVKALRGEGEQSEATIEFVGVGEKRFLLALTPLKRA